jgi:hypothetical protein
VLFFPGWIAEFACLCPSADLRRKLSLAGAFILFGSIACVSSVMLLMAQNEDAGRAFALARVEPDQPLIRLGLRQTAPTRIEAEKVTTAEPMSSCQSELSVNAACETGTPPNTPPLAADAHAPGGTAALPGDQPAAANPDGTILAASTAPMPEITIETRDAAAASVQPETPLPQASASKPQKPARHQARRYNSNNGFSLFAFDQRSRARLRPLFW